MLNRLLSGALFLTLCACTEAPQKTVAAPPSIQIAKPADETRRFPMDGRETVEVIDNHLFGKEFLPGGNIAQYKKGGKNWRQFVIKAEDPGQTAILLGRFKDNLKDPKFVAHMGGYFGMDGETPLFVFPKGRWIAGVTGLPEKEADILGRQMALRLD